MSDKVYPGTVIRVDDKGARRIPWHQADTIGEVGESTRLKRKQRKPVDFTPQDPIVETSAREKAEKLTIILIAEIEKMRMALGRPVTTADLSDDWLRALGIETELWAEGEPVLPERLRKTAEVYLNAIAMSGGQPLPKEWTPKAP